MRHTNVLSDLPSPNGPSLNVTGATSSTAGVSSPSSGPGADAVDDERCKQMANPPSRTSHSCAECRQSFTNLGDLEAHATWMGHGALRCDHGDCTSTFTRRSDLDRHRSIHSDRVQRHPCPHCRKYRGENGFKRKDHLKQHIRNYHHVDVTESVAPYYFYYCPIDDCFASKKQYMQSRKSAFQKDSEIRVHMKEVHDGSPYPCPERDCTRVKGKGYFRKRDLVNHLKKDHEWTDGFEQISSQYRGVYRWR